MTEFRNRVRFTVEDIPYSGKIWVRRGVLAERLCRSRFGEQAYRHAIDKGFSLFAWSRLMGLYMESGNPKAVLICVAEILKQFKEEGVNVSDTVKPI